jgi:inorganic pyrophosphatase
MADEAGPDEKVLAVPNRNPRYDEIRSIDQIFPHVRREIEHFFAIYKELEAKTEIGGWRGTEEARAIIQESRQCFLNARA